VRNVGDCAFIANQIRALSFLEMLFENRVQTPGFVLIPVDAVFDMLGSVSREMV
jgi:hypothetical protein